MVTLTAPAPRAADSRAERLRHLGPNWYATVMGTAITANAGVGLPYRTGFLPRLCEGVWVLAAAMLVAVLAGRAVRWVRHPDAGVRDLLDPAVAPFYGCLSMAMLAVGAGALTAGRPVVGAHGGVVLDAVLWSAGAVTGVVVAAGVPYLMITRHRIGHDDATPAWLLPVVPPMVAAALGPALLPHLPAGAGQAREALLLGCLAMFGISLLSTLVALPLIWSRLLRTDSLPIALTPALFLVLGPLGQSVTATGTLSDAAPAAHLPAPYPAALHAFTLLYGVPVMGFALLWLALAAALTVRAVSRGMRFSMVWWAFTFPVGTCVTGAEGLARHTGLHALSGLSAGLYVLLVAAVLAAGTGTVRGVARGELLPRHAAA